MGVNYVKYLVWYGKLEEVIVLWIVEFVDCLNVVGIEFVGVLDVLFEEYCEDFGCIDMRIVLIFDELELWMFVLNYVLICFLLKIDCW